MIHIRILWPCTVPGSGSLEPENLEQMKSYEPNKNWRSNVLYLHTLYCSTRVCNCTRSYNTAPEAVLRIRIRMFLDFPDPDPSLFARILIRIRMLCFHHQGKIWLLYDFLSLKNNVNVIVIGKLKNQLLASWMKLTKRARSGEGSGSDSQWHGPADPDPEKSVPVLYSTVHLSTTAHTPT